MQESVKTSLCTPSQNYRFKRLLYSNHALFPSILHNMISLSSNKLIQFKKKKRSIPLKLYRIIIQWKPKPRMLCMKDQYKTVEYNAVITNKPKEFMAVASVSLS